MTLTKNIRFSVQPIFGEVDEVTLAEPGSTNEAEALPLTLTHAAEASDWTYNVSTEDNGTTGILDDEAGITYNGPNGNFARVTVTNVDTVEHAITPPAEGATSALALYINSDLFDIGDEGFVEHQGEVTTENNIDTIVGPFNEGDVLRVAIAFTGEDDNGDLDVAPGEITIT